MSGTTYFKSTEKGLDSRPGPGGGAQAPSKSYLKRLKHRQKEKNLKENILFGLSLGWVLTLVGVFRYLFLIDGPVWLYVCYSGLALLSIAVIVPDLAGYPRRLMRFVAGAIANQLFKALLALLYFLVIMPVGLISQKMKGRDPFYFWTNHSPSTIEGWVDKKSSDQNSLVGADRGPISTFLQPMQVLGYFATNGQVVLMPCLLIFLLLAVMGIFLQSAALAPFIYTLF